jgi:serine/alanine adding enzyme
VRENVSVMTDWDARVLAAQPGAHFMQSDAWATLKQGSAWTPSRLEVARGAGISPGATYPVQVFSRPVVGLGTLRHAPRITGVTEDLVPALTAVAESSPRGSLAMKLEFFQDFDQPLVDSFIDAGWKVCKASQYRHAVVVDTTGDEDALLARFKKRCRYEVRLAERSGVTVQSVPVTDANMLRLLTLIRETENRTGAFFRSDDYLLRSWAEFARRGQGFIYLAEHEGELVAGAFVMTFGSTGWYKDGGSTREKDKLGGARFLQFCIMRDLQARGVTAYDLGVIPPAEQAENSAMKGLFTFKTSFSETTTTFMPALQFPLARGYNLWHKYEGRYLGAYSRLKKDYWY